MAVRQLSGYRWRRDFHKLCWERIKELKPELPRWTWEQLIRNGWYIRMSRTNPRTEIDLIHQDGSYTSFRLSINGQTMPHVSAIIMRLFGCENFDRAPRRDCEIIQRQLSGISGIRCVLESTRMSITISTASGAAALLGMIESVERDNTYIDPSITTAETFAKGVIRPMPIFYVNYS